jgi:hypothetical protein
VRPCLPTASDAHPRAGKITINGRSLAVNADFAQQALFLAQQLKCSEKYIASILHATMSAHPNSGLVNAIEATVVEFHQRRRHLVDCLRYLFEAAELAQLPDAPRLYLRLEAFVRQELVPAAKSDASLASRIFKEIDALGAAVAQAQMARQNAQSNTVPPSGPGALPFSLLALTHVVQVHNPLSATIFSMPATTHSSMSDATSPWSTTKSPVSATFHPTRYKSR